MACNYSKRFGGAALSLTALRRCDVCGDVSRRAAYAGSGHSLAATSIHAAQLLVLAHSCSETRENESYQTQDRRAAASQQSWPWRGLGYIHTSKSPETYLGPHSSQLGRLLTGGTVAFVTGL